MTVLSDRVDVLESTNANLVSILQNLQSTFQGVVDAGQGPQGWSPVMTVQSDGARRVLQVTDWKGGGGTKPSTGDYIGSSGLVSTTGAAIDIRGDAGEDGDGWTGASYDSGTGIVTFTSDDGLGFSTGDIRGDKGDTGDTGPKGDTGDTGPKGDTGDTGPKGDPGALFNWTGAWADQTAYVEGDGAESGGSSYVATADHTADSTTEPGVGASWETVWDLSAAAGDKGDTGDGFTGGSYDSGTGVVTFASDDGLGFSTDDLRGADGTGAGTVTSVDVTGGTGVTASGGPVTSSGSITVELDSATQTSLGLADTATQPGDLGLVATSNDYDDLDNKPSLSAGNMQAATYDPQSIEADVFARANHTGTQPLSTVSGTGTAAASDASDFATSAQGGLADTAQQPPTEGAFVDGDKTKLDAAATLTGTETLANKTLTDPAINVGTDATGDLYYRAADGSFERLPVGADDEVLTLASGLPSWAAGGGGAGLLQTIQDVKSDTASTTSTTFVDTGLSVTITLTDAANKVNLLAAVSAAGDSDQGVQFRFMRGTTAIGVGDAAGSRTQVSFATTRANDAILSVAGAFLDAPGQVGPHTYKVQWSVPDSSGRINSTLDDNNNAEYPRSFSSLTAQEVT